MKKYTMTTAWFDDLARKLKPLQRAILRELIDRYMQAERPIQDSDLEDFGGARHPDVRAILNTCFEASEKGWQNATLDAQIEVEKAKTESRKRAGKARWQGKRAHAKHMLSTCSAHAKHMLSMAQPCGSEGDSGTSGGDYRGGNEKKKKKTTLSNVLLNPPKRPPLESAPAWLDNVCLWFGRAQGYFTVAEHQAAEQIEAEHRPKAADLATLGRYYSAAFPAGRDFRRRSLGALLANWSTELDRARMHARTAKRQEGVL